MEQEMIVRSRTTLVRGGSPLFNCLPNFSGPAGALRAQSFNADKNGIDHALPSRPFEPHDLYN
eukprot:1153588-Pelagomonas_calceolata.AAC.8